MSRGAWLPLASILVLALACSGTPTMDHEQLASERKQIHSLDVEALLFEQVVQTRRATRTFERGHAIYLQHSAHEIVQTLSKARPATGAEREFAQISADAARLEQRFVGLRLLLQ